MKARNILGQIDVVTSYNNEVYGSATTYINYQYGNYATLDEWIEDAISPLCNEVGVLSYFRIGNEFWIRRKMFELETSAHMKFTET